MNTMKVTRTSKLIIVLTLDVIVDFCLSDERVVLNGDF